MLLTSRATRAWRSVGAMSTVAAVAAVEGACAVPEQQRGQRHDDDGQGHRSGAADGRAALACLDPAN